MNLPDDLVYEILHRLPPTDTISVGAANKIHMVQVRRILPRIARQFIDQLAIRGITNPITFYFAMGKPHKKMYHKRHTMMGKILESANLDWIHSLFNSVPQWADPQSIEYFIAEFYYMDKPIKIMKKYTDEILMNVYDGGWDNEIVYLASVYAPGCPDPIILKNKLNALNIYTADIDNWCSLTSNIRYISCHILGLAIVANQPAWVKQFMEFDDIYTKKYNWDSALDTIKFVSKDAESVIELLKYRNLVPDTWKKLIE